MAIELHINGYYEMQVFNLHTGERLPEDLELGVLDNLQQGEYFIGINSKTIVSIDDLMTPLYKFDLEATTAVEYKFDEL